MKKRILLSILSVLLITGLAWGQGNVTHPPTGAAIQSAPNKTTPADTDKTGVVDTSGNLFSTTWANVKATLKTYFDSIYQAAGNFVNLQTSTPGTAQTGHTNISGTGISGKVETQEAYFTSIVNNGNSSTAATIDWTAGSLQKITTTGSCILTFTAPTGPTTVILKIIHEASATAYTYTWPTTVKWQSAVAPTTTNTSGAVDIISLFYDGTNYYSTFALDMR